jgi:hypothetical protein
MLSFLDKETALAGTRNQQTFSEFSVAKQSGWSYTEKASWLKAVSCNKFHPNNLLLINTQGKFEVLTVMKVTTLQYCDVTPCRLVRRYQRFGEIFVSVFRAENSSVSKKKTKVVGNRLSFVLQQLHKNSFMHYMCYFQFKRIEFSMKP